MSNLILSPFSSHSGGGGKSQLRKWYESMGGGALAPRAMKHVSETANVVRAVGESAVVGAALGYASVTLQNGLDYNVQGHNVPIDGALALVGAAGAIGLAHEPIAADLRNAAASGATLWAFRKTQEYIASKKGTAAKSKVHGDFGAEDPIVAAARGL